MNKDVIINDLIYGMYGELSNDQLDMLKRVAERVFYNINFTDDETTEVCTFVDDNFSVLNKYKIDMILQQKASGTIDHYIRETKKFLEFINKNFREIKPDDVKMYISYLLQCGKQTANTLDNIRKYVKQFFNWLFDNDYIPKNPFAKIKPIKRIEKEKIVLSDDEIEEIRDNCDSDQELALIDLLISTGLRVSEVQKIKVSDIDFIKREIKIYSIKTQKYRTVYLDAKAIKHICSYLNRRKTESDILFVSKRNNVFMCKSTIQKIIKRIVTKTSIRKHVTVHMFRKTLATNLYKKGMSIEKIAILLGHASTTTTIKYYCLINNNDIKDEFMMKI